MKGKHNRIGFYARRGLDNRGFTLLEMMVAAAVAVFFIGVTFTLVNFATRSYRAQERIVDAQQDLRAALDFMSREIRMAGYNPMRHAGAGIEAATGDTLTFTADLDRSNVIEDGMFERVSYFYNEDLRRVERRFWDTGGNLQSQVLIEKVSAFFNYLDRDDAPTAGSAARVVRITLVYTDRDAQGDNFERTMNSVIKCRNLY